ncbi:MAG: glycosyltransferase family 2 protein [Gaiellaceae bacterium]
MESNRYLAEPSGESHQAARHHSEVARDVSIVIVCHNNRGEIDRCVESVLDLGCSVFLIDAASRDDSAAHVRERYPAVHVVELAENRGFGAAANDGFELARTRYVLLINADAWPESGAVESLVAAADRTPSLGAIGPRLVYADGSDQRSIFGYPQSPTTLGAFVALPGVIDRLYALWQRIRGRKERRRAAHDVVVVPHSEFVSGAALLVRREAFVAVAGFDRRFFMYCEEIDLCRRLRHTGWTIAFHPRATFAHVGGASTSQEPERMYGELIQSYLCFIAKHRGLTAARRARIMALGALALRGFVSSGPERRRARAALRRLRVAGAQSALESFSRSPS